MEARTAELTQDYYTLGQFSKFVRRGAVFHTSGAQPSVKSRHKSNGRTARHALKA